MKKRILTFLLSIGTLAVAAAPVKVVERSAAKRPAWLGTAVREHVVVSAEAATLDEARQRCLSDIRQCVVTAVAVNVSSEEITADGQLSRNGRIDRYGSYLSEVKSIAGQLPFLTGIDLSKGEIYWERCLVKAEKRYYYVCHAKYPFSEAERDLLIARFRKQDRERYAEYLELRRALPTFTRIDFVAEAMARLTSLLDYFFDDVRRSEVRTLRDSYRRCYERVMCVPQESRLGEYLFALEMDGRRMTTSRPPRAVSELATDIRIVPADGGLYRVTYDYGTVTADDSPTIDLSFRLGTKTLKHRICFDVRESMMAVCPFGWLEIDLTETPAAPAPAAEEAAASAPAPAEAPVAETAAADSVATTAGTATAGTEAAERSAAQPSKPVVCDAQLRLWLRSRYDTSFEVLGLDLRAEGLGGRLTVACSAAFEGKGEHRLMLPVRLVVVPTAERAALAAGSLKVRHGKTGEVREVRVALPCRILNHTQR